MKKILLICFFVTTSLSAQEDKIRDFFWGKDDPHSKTMTIPDKWKNESAVMIYKYEFHDYHKFGSNVNYTSALRNRVKLLDEAAVKEYSEFTFKERFSSDKGWSRRAGKNILGIKVVKPDGKETIINVSKEAVDADKEKKIAIPNLEIGDIIDYYLHSEEPFKSQLEMGFDPVERTLGDVYPIMDYKLIFQTENDFFLNFATYNGAPELKEIPSNKGGERHYEFAAKDIEKNEFPRWFYPLIELPCYKFQVFFARSGKFEKRAEAFLSEKESIVKSTVSKEDVFNYYNTKFRPYGDLGHIEKFLKGKSFSSDEEKVREVYYFTRHQYFTQYIEAFVAKDANIFYPFDLYPNAIFFQKEEEFINHFMAFLKDNKIPYDIVIGTARYNGPITDLLIQQNITILLRVNTANPVYLEFFTPFSSADQFNYQLENTKAYLLQISKNKKVVDSEMITLPGSTKKDNISRSITKIKLNEDLTSIKVDRENFNFGQYKPSEQSNKLYFFDYVYDDYQKYGTTSLLEKVKNKKKKDQYQKEFDALIAKYKDKQKENFTNSVKEEFGHDIEDYTMDVENSGRFGSKEPMAYKESFTIKDHYIKKAGNNIILEVGKFLTSQIELSEKEKNRTNNVYMSFPRQIEHEIQFEIPEGYTASGLDKFNKNAENETGGFVSSVSQNGNLITIKTTKSYNNYYEPNSNWNKMIDFLEDAFQFTQEKILLKKN
ncbi:DUF3857 domain-containing protein [Flavobacterium azooxidireducens]|uniref:DUF3857 domain-containing protein n=1 Tax=Flavobacterium azooxidireducens TaxID=1871076 RepID=A0ABY4KE97_9FLAO|nr:DUF3857 domain-containing protein [Flavobacterium azooxidireducens]UPQ78053.1 DUF3857 domain-containing protein [Flavobacterium azooxidireducens]